MIVNGVPAGEDIVPAREGERLFLRRADLVALGVPLPRDAPALTAIDTLPGVTATVDPATQTLRLDFAVHDRMRNRLRLGTTRDDGPLTPSATGALLNYDIEARAQGGRTTVGGLFEARAFAPLGTVSTSVLVNPLTPLGGERVVRLDSSYTVADVARLRRYSLGDIISGGLATSRSVRLGGGQISTDFSVRPDLVTYPVPVLGGSAAVPSTVDVLVNGTRVGGGAVAAGDFAVAGTPVINGSGTVDVVLRDALGRETRQSFAVYGVRTLLAPGLSACTLDAGAVRRNYALRSDDYRFLAGTATCRMGLDDRLTLEGHAEAAGDLVLAGGGAVIGLGRFGVASLGLAASAAATGRGAMHGGQFALGYELIGRPFSFNLQAVVATRGYRDIAARAGDAAVRTSILSVVGAELGRFGSVSAGFTRRVGAPLPGPAEQAFQARTGVIAADQPRASLITVTYSATVARRVTVFADALHDVDRQQSTVALVGLSLAFGPRTSLVASATRREGGTDSSIELDRAVTEPGEYGYRFADNRGAVTRDLAEGRYRGSWGEVSGGVERVGDSVAARAGISGGIVLAGGGLLAGNTIGGSFAVVDAGVGGVAVLRDNRLAGVTDRGGRLLVPDLRSFEANSLAIDPVTLPDDAQAAATSVALRPRDRSGVVADFGVRRVRAARVRLVTADGTPIAPGSRAALNGSEAVPVGYDGEAYLSGLTAHNEVTATLAGGTTCRATFTLAAGPVPALIGPVPCR